MFRIKIVAGFLLALAVVAAGIWFAYTSLNQLAVMTRQAVKPDEGIIKLKELVADVNNVESGVRAFAITQDQKYLEPYYSLLNDVDSRIDTLKKYFDTQHTSIDSIQILLKEKLSVYDELIDVRYNNLISIAIDKISGKVIENAVASDSVKPVAEMKRNFFQKLFGSKRKQELEQKAQELDSLKTVQQLHENEIRHAVKKINEEENNRLAALASKELELLSRDKNSSVQLQAKVKKVEQTQTEIKKQQAENYIFQMRQQRNLLFGITAVGGLLILILAVVILVDINRGNRYKKQLVEERNRAEKLAKFKEEFLANMSHELRTPVSALSGFTLRLQNTELTTEQKQYVKNIATSSNHLLNIINDVLDISRIETGNLKLDKTAFSVYEVAKEVVDLLSIKALEKNLELNFEGEKVKDFSVIGDSMRLRQVLFNVIGNAIKFTESGSVKLQIENLKHENQISNFRFQISDTGIGIPSEKIKTIFKPFEQADMGIARKFGGTGLGLSITKKIVELHGGTIDVKSETEKGTTFSIDIPYEINEGLAQDKFENGNLKFEIANKAYPKNEKFLSGINVLLAEDDDLNRILQQSMLNDLGASVDAVSNGEEVLFKLQSKKYDVLLMDLQMPEIGGIEAATRIRNDLKSAIPIVAITANVHATDKEKCFAAGINDVLIKPFSEQQLIEKISALIKIENKYAVEFVEEIKQVEISKPYSLDALRKASNGNPDFVARMLKVFCMSGESLMQKAEEGMMTLDKEKIASSVHRLIPSCRQLALNDLSASLKQVENLCAGENDFSRVKDLLMQSKNNFTNIVAMLQHEIQLLEKAKTES